MVVGLFAPLACRAALERLGAALVDSMKKEVAAIIHSFQKRQTNAAARFLFNEDKPKASNTAKEESFLSLVAVGAR